MADPEKVRSDMVAMLRDDPRGLSVTEVSRKMGLNRNTVARYLDVLQVSGRIEMRNIGKAKLYYPSYSVPMNAMLNFSSDLIMVLDRTGSVLEMNRNLLGLLGSRREMMMGRNMVEHPLPILEGMDLRRVLRKVIKGNDHLFEVRMVREDRTVHLRGRMLPTSFADGSKGVTLIFEDVSEKKRSELKLKESESRYRTLFDNSLDALLIVDDDRVLDANDAALVLYGLRSKEEIIGKRSYDFSPAKQPDGTNSADMIKWGMGEVLKGKDFQFEWVQLRKGMGPIETLMTVRPIVLNGKTMVHAMMRDISEKKVNDGRFRAMEERLRSIMPSFQDSFLALLDPDLNITELWTSEGMRRRLMVPPNKPPGKRVTDLFPKEGREKALGHFNRVQSTGEQDRFEDQMVLTEGTSWFDINLNLTRDPYTEERGLVMFAMDVSEQHRLKEDLERTASRTRVLDETLRDIIWMADDELRFIFLSSSVEKVLGYGPEELSGESIEKVLTERSSRNLRASVSALLQGRRSKGREAEHPVLLELESIKKDGTKVWTEIGVAIHHEKGGVPVRIVGAT
ncbi:MAG: PAS domain S-box protein, partial [Candidatus Thermoplasmatota archaeon]|nr:PAS domain S-box protein [Candidatus Thermoplasmatota archaeon]